MSKNHFLFLWILVMISVNVSAQNIKGYYTRLDFDDADITGKYADIVIELDDIGKFIFSREYSYQPYWQPYGGNHCLVERLIPRDGDGPRERPDKHNISSNAAIVNRTDTSVTVHWRYAPDVTKPSFIDFNAAYNEFGNPSPFYAEYADEYFTISSKGTVSRVAKKGCYLLDEWNDPDNHFFQLMNLNSTGIENVSLKRPSLSGNYKTFIHGTENKPIDETDAVMIIHFDEAVSRANAWTSEKISGEECKIIGVKDYWEKGISGTALFFDSYSNGVVLPKEKVPQINSAFTISAWIAPLEYPFNVAAIIDHLNGNSGYLLGMNRLGEIVFKAGDGVGLTGLKTAPVSLYDWTYIVAVYDPGEGIKIFLNGKLAAENNAEFHIADAKNSDIVIGMTRSFRQFPYGAERNVTMNFMSNMVFSGIIDELMVFDTDLGRERIEINYRKQVPGQLRHFRPYVLPSGNEYGSTFGARFTKLDYNKGWDGLWRTGPYSDLVVYFENQPWRYVFWRGTRYLPSLVTDFGRSGIWSNDQGPEVFDGRCYEHMSDKLCRFTNIRLISDSPARVIVHWRNALVDINYRWPKLNDLGQGLWTDEYWTIYPDGTCVRHQLLHNSVKERIIEMNQNEILLHPGQKPEDAILNNALILGNERGEFETFSRLNEVPGIEQIGKFNILYTNLNSSTKQFQIGELGTRIESNLRRDVWWNGWDHYPAQLIPSDGTRAIKNDRSVSFCPSTFREFRRFPDNKTFEAMQIFGLTKLKPEELLPLHKSWNFSAELIPIEGCVAMEYNKAEKAFYLKRQGDNIRFQINATDTSPLVNPAFVITNWDIKNKIQNILLTVNDILLKANEYRLGIEIDNEGNYMLVVWLNYSTIDTLFFKLYCQAK